MIKNRLLLIAAVLLLAALCGCNAEKASAEAGSQVGSAPASSEGSSSASSEESSSEQEGMSFFGEVLETESDFGGILVQSEDENIASPVVVHGEGLEGLCVGDRIRVDFKGQITLSYPGQIFGATVTLLKE